MANGFGTPIARPVARVREYVDIVRTEDTVLRVLATLSGALATS